MTALVVAGFDTPTELPVGLARSDKANPFEYADRRGTLSVTPRHNDTYLRLTERPLDERMCCFARVPPSAPIWDHAIADLHGAIRVWRPKEADITDHRRRLPLDDHPHAEGLIVEAGCGLDRQYVQEVRVWPVDG